MQSKRFIGNPGRWLASSALVCLFLVVSVSLVYAAHSWTQQTTPSTPSARCGHAMTYIGGDQVLLFSGYDGAYENDTWVYDLSDNTWTQKTTASTPSARDAHAMAYLGGDQVLLFGGWNGPPSYKNDTWVYDLSDNTWTQKTTASTPSVRAYHAMAYLGGDQVLLFGGWDGSSYKNDTWVYDLSDNTWTQKTTASAPSARDSHAMAYLGSDQVLLFGGFDGSSFKNDTWVYDLSDNTWTQKSPITSPSVRDAHAMAYLSGDQVLLFGGYDGSPSFKNDTWVYDLSDNTWTQKSPITSPSVRNNHAMAYLGNEWAVLFGGWDNNYRNDTWVAGGMGPTAVTLASFGAHPRTFALFENLEVLGVLGIALVGAGWFAWRRARRSW